MKHLTTYRLARLRKGDAVYYRGEQFEIFGIWPSSVLLVSLEKPGKQVTKVPLSEVEAYTAGLAVAHTDYVRSMAAHSAEVRSRRYSSRYFPPAPLELWETRPASWAKTLSYGL